MGATPMINALNIARWAPSGDNSQPWRFKILDDVSVRIRVSRQLDNPYEYKDGTPVLIGLGALLESLRIAASAEGYSVEWQYERYAEPDFMVTATLVAATLKPDPLLPYILTRSVNRKPMKSLPLSPADQEKLAASLGEPFRIVWFTTLAEKLSLTQLNALAADIRLRIPEAYPIHKHIIEWEDATSETKMPVATLPATPIARRLMRWVLQSWHRVHFMNRFMGGTVVPILELEVGPGLRCGAHFAIEAANDARDVKDVIAHGVAMQRFWLTATSLGLTLQPSFAPLIFGHYGNHAITFTRLQTARRTAVKLGKKLRVFYGKYQLELDRVVFTGRIGFPYPTKKPSRSLRIPLEQLIEN